MRKTTSAYCPTCEKQTLHAKEGISNLLHLFLKSSIRSLSAFGSWPGLTPDRGDPHWRNDWRTGVDSAYEQPRRKDPQVVGDREETLTANTLQMN